MDSNEAFWMPCSAKENLWSRDDKYIQQIVTSLLAGFLGAVVMLKLSLRQTTAFYLNTVYYILILSVFMLFAN